MPDRPPFELGFTLATSCLPCPHRYRVARATPRGQNDSDAALVGTAVHVVMLRINRGVLDRRAKPGQAGRSQDIGMFRNIVGKVMEEFGFIKDSDLARYFLALCKQAEAWKVPKFDGEAFIEERMSIDRNWNKCDNNPGFDCVAGTADFAWVSDGGLSGGLVDFKAGNRHFGYDAAGQSVQLRTYAWLFFEHHPKLRKVSGTIEAFTLHGCSSSTADFYRDPTCEDMRKFYGKKFEQLDRLYEEFGTGEWPTHGDAACCGYCPVHCPALPSITDGAVQ